jgi:phosphocarrier protein FPr
VRSANGLVGRSPPDHRLDGPSTPSRALVAVCGELAADEHAAAGLIGLGVRELSVGPAAVPGVKQAVRAVDTEAAAALAARALEADGPARVRELITPVG